MSKITILLCAVLFAAAVDARLLSGSFQRIGGIVERIIQNKMERLQQLRESFLRRIDKFSSDLDKSHNGYKSTLLKNVRNVENELTQEIKMIVNGSTDIDLNECHYKDRLSTLQDEAADKMSECLEENKDEGHKQSEKVENDISETMKKLFDGSEEIRRCHENINSFISIGSAVICSQRAKVRGALDVARAVPNLIRDVFFRTIHLFTAKTSLAMCVARNGLRHFSSESRAILNEVKACVRNKVNEARHAELKI